MTFFSLFDIALQSVFYGLIATAATMALLYVILQTVERSIVRTPIFYVTGAVLSVLLMVQFTLLIGAVQAKSMAGAIEVYLTQMLEHTSGVVGANDSQRIFDAVTEHFPLVGAYVGLADFSGHEMSDLPAVMVSTVEEFFTTYIWQRTGWIFGFIAVAVLIVFFFAKPNRDTGRRDSGSARHRGERPRNAESRHQRVARSRRR